MASLGKTVWVAHVWLTALLTLFAGSPRVQCRCPDGTLKPFCLSFVFGTSAFSCCCGDASTASHGRCCSAPAAPPKQEGECPCCAHRHHKGTRAAKDGASVGGHGCVKTLVQPRDLALTASETDSLTDSVSVAALPSPEPPAHFAFSERDPFSDRAHVEAPPPTDLVTVLQRFLI